METGQNVYGESVDKIVQGNAQPLHSKLATPQGWLRMGDVRIGDEILTPRGTATTVTGVYPRGTRSVYEIVTEDGSMVEACGEHLWDVIIED